MSEPVYLTRDDAELAVFDFGNGMPVLFQHGLGGSDAQVAQAFPDGGGFRRLTVECRGHGSSSLGSRRPFSIAMFAEDVLAAADRCGIERLAVGGISMGAAIALHLAHFHKDRIAALVLVRPAWTFDAAPENMAPIRTVGKLILAHPIEQARDLFVASETGAELERDAPDNFASLLGYFDRPNAAAFAKVLVDIASDGPDVTKASAAALDVPTLVIGNRQDAIHPLSSAETLAATIPGAAFLEVAAKAADKARHFAETQSAISQFLSSETLRSRFAS
ncbi:alpha/beta fold hydrolase [Rhizobium tumorigenes]|uniref:alpha/beta fold hydrolase n=1 Tax=Rhizobium tumorigenes TaxID=2041385 RepID=UPI00241C2E21|nr:alpha/beta hydrolase [Rhizobium tumorigenes]WFS04396.1 alpha/beta hydrolase [Rhizobium tumorigenes]